jgi:hypothetical protein
MVYTTRSFENINKEWLVRSDMSFKHETETVNAAAKKKGEEEVGENESEIHTNVRRSLNYSQKQANITSYFSKITPVL